MSSTRRDVVPGSRWQDRDTRTGVRVVEVVEVDNVGRYAVIRRVRPDGAALPGTGGRRTRILVLGLLDRFDLLPAEAAAVVPASDDVDAAIRVAVVAWHSEEARAIERDTYGAEKGHSFTHGRHAAEAARLGYAVRAALAHLETRP